MSPVALGAALLLAAIAVWGAVHSWLASRGAKDAVARAGASRVYRLAYNLFALLTFMPIVVLLTALPDRLIYEIRPPWLYFTLALQLLAAAGLFAAVLHTDVVGFIGLKQLWGGEEAVRLVTGGLYRYMRHPMYFFSLVILWLTPVITVNTLVTYLGLTAYIWIGAYFEERKLVRQFGPAYAEYRARTPMIVPVKLFRAGRV